MFETAILLLELSMFLFKFFICRFRQSGLLCWNKKLIKICSGREVGNEWVAERLPTKIRIHLKIIIIWMRCLRFYIPHIMMAEYWKLRENIQNILGFAEWTLLPRLQRFVKKKITKIHQIIIISSEVVSQ